MRGITIFVKLKDLFVNNTYRMLQIPKRLTNSIDGGLVRKKLIYYNSKATHHFFFGDESAIGLFNAYKEIALKNNHEYFGVVELNANNNHILNRLKLLIESVPPSPGQGAQNAIQWMEDMHPNCWKAWKKASFYLAGPRELIAAFREYLLQKEVSEAQIRITN